MKVSVESLDTLDRRILLALDENPNSAKGICEFWGLPEDDSSNIRYRIRERLGGGRFSPVQVFRSEDLPGAAESRKIYALSFSGSSWVSRHRDAIEDGLNDDLPEPLQPLSEDVDSARERADDAMSIAEKQRERVNNLQRDHHAVNERSKETRERLQEVERDVWEDQWGDPSLRDQIEAVEDASINRANELAQEIESVERESRREFAGRGDFKDLRQTVDRLRGENKQLQTENEGLRDEVGTLNERLAHIEDALASPGGLKGFFFD